MASSAKKVEKEKNQHIQVYVRCRPANLQEKKGSSPIVVAVNDSKEVVIKERVADKELTKKYTFDRVFGPESCQIDVYKTVANPLIDDVLKGYNCTVFAYGQTGTGKTYTMQGCKSEELYTWDTDPESGIIPRTFHHLFEALTLQEVEYTVRVSYLELYNEELFDLLGAMPDISKLRLFEDSARKGSVVIQGLTEIVVSNKDEVYHILERGAERRRVASTLLNDMSSRSHTVFSITVHIKENTMDGEDLVKVGKFNLVDLAGSECIGRSGAIDKRAREAGNINQSLLTLGRVITALVEKAPHVPYRESKLTRLLQDSLGGRTKTSIIATISPALTCSEETNSTLEYAHRAKNITNKPEINQKMTKRALIREYTEEIERLRRDLTATQERNGIFVDVENYNTMRAQMSNQSEAIKDYVANVAALKEQIEKIKELFEKSQAEVAKKTHELQRTCETLGHTTAELRRTDKALRRTAFEKEEQKHLVAQHVKTEKQLSSQAAKLLSVADSTTGDLAGVFSKLDRKSRVETKNQKMLREHRSNLTGMLLNMKNGLAERLNSHEGRLEALQLSLDANMSTITSCVQKQSDEMSILMSQANVHSSSMVQAIHELQARSQMETEKLFQAHSQAELERLHGEKTLVDGLVLPGLKALSKVNDDLRQSVQLIHSLHSQQMQEQAQVLAAGFSSLRMDVLHFQNSMDKLLLEQEETNALNLQLSQERQQKKLDNLDMIMKLVTRCALEENDHDSKVTSLIRDRGSSSVSQQHSLKEMVSIQQASIESLEQDIKLKTVAGSEQMFSSLSTIESYLGDVQQKHVDLHDKTVVNHEQELELITKSRIVQDELLTTCKTTIHESLPKFVCKTQEHYSATESIVVPQASSSEEMKEVFSLHKRSQTNAVKQLANWGQELGENITPQLDSCRKEIDNFVENEVLVDVPTGLTPQRKEYIYPRYLAASSSQDVLLAQFRQALDPSAASGISVPDSPVKEQELLEDLKDEISDTASETGSESGKIPASNTADAKENKDLHHRHASKNKGKQGIPRKAATKNLLRPPNYRLGF